MQYCLLTQQAIRDQGEFDAMRILKYKRVEGKEVVLPKVKGVSVVARADCDCISNQ